MGPIADEVGVEQGGVNSGDFYKIYGKSQLELAQDSSLGVHLTKDIVISAIGQADDTVLISNDLHSLQNLLQLSLFYCAKFNVSLCPEKTILQAICPKKFSREVEYLKEFSPVNLNGIKLKFHNIAEHVGIIRSVSGNHPNILQRFSSHKKAIGAVLCNGLARHHRANPAARLKIEQIFGTPVLLSGLGSLLLKKSELTIVTNHYLEILLNLLRLLPGTPHPVIYFLSGSLPGEALIHLRQLGLLGMISRMPGSILHQYASEVFTSRGTAWSWFHQVRDLCLKYQLPHPLTFLTKTITKEAFKNLVKKHVINFWELKLRADADPLLSLKYFKPEFMSLLKPHPLLVTAGAHPYEVAKAGVQALFLSGRYRTELLCSHWSNNEHGHCLLPSCAGLLIKEDLEHILLNCGSLALTRQRLSAFTIKFSNTVPLLSSALLQLTNPSHQLFIQFLLDCSVIPQVISLAQVHGEDVYNQFFKVSRTWCYSLHRERLRILGRWAP